jgi:RNA polymerase sigma-70 factor (ECF subfamily)
MKRATTPSDAELIAAVRAGDDAALDTLLARHTAAVYRFGMKLCRDSEDAKDVVQDTLFAAVKGVRAFRGGSSLSTWLYAVARSFCIKRHRASKFAPKEIVSLDDPSVDKTAIASQPDETASGRELSAILDHAIDALDEPSREVFVMRDIEGLTAPEVARVLGVSVDAVKSRLHRARARVRQELVGQTP